ncbi:MAG: hypothetical protein CVT77_11600 [Alphaproteobacteria bacterium HGW-Alphaproteobacteria-16]|nr:MAG: hypothetical protein CVT77_11600 [Alphaproteobacteria bacterium HGW-Alphaproteobacteria-16]
MTPANDTHPAPSPRALRLRREAENCLDIAVRQKDAAFAADLIDEAVRLTRRAQELGAMQPPPRIVAPNVAA